ncbi:MAG: antibiotic biosynthesis monooxygenase [Paludibacteraceae bacterium]|nr:antibiotic biosynthesis monooxygenase [Paludibacteraceae bacterium]
MAGNLQYEFFLSDKGCNSVLLVEKWSSEEYLKAYLASEFHKVLENLFPCVVVPVKVEQYSV